MKRSFLDYATITLKGIGMGAADVVPGVSGGTIAFITGIYEELINSIKGALPACKELLGKKSFSQRISDFWKALNGNFLIALIAGIALAMGLLANVVKYMLEHYPILINAFFFGLILASIVLVYNKVSKWTWICLLFGIIGIGLALLLPESTSIYDSPTVVPLWYLFVCGCIAICAMILPGISGSFILVLLGAYNAFITAIKDFNLLYLVVFGSGAVIGLIAFSNVLSWLLKKFHDWTVALLTGFIIGSLNIIWPWKASVDFYINANGVPFPNPAVNVLPTTYQFNTWQSPMLTEAIAACILGIVLVLGIELIAKLFSKKKS